MKMKKYGASTLFLLSLIFLTSTALAINGSCKYNKFLTYDSSGNNLEIPQVQNTEGIISWIIQGDKLTFTDDNQNVYKPTNSKEYVSIDPVYPYFFSDMIEIKKHGGFKNKEFSIQSGKSVERQYNVLEKGPDFNNTPITYNGYYITKLNSNNGNLLQFAFYLSSTDNQKRITYAIDLATSSPVAYEEITNGNQKSTKKFELSDCQFNN